MNQVPFLCIDHTTTNSQTRSLGARVAAKFEPIPCSYHGRRSAGHDVRHGSGMDCWCKEECSSGAVHVVRRIRHKLKKTTLTALRMIQTRLPFGAAFPSCITNCTKLVDRYTAGHAAWTQLVGCRTHQQRDVRRNRRTSSRTTTPTTRTRTKGRHESGSNRRGLSSLRSLSRCRPLRPDL